MGNEQESELVRRYKRARIWSMVVVVSALVTAIASSLSEYSSEFAVVTSLFVALLGAYNVYKYTQIINGTAPAPMAK